MHAYISNQIIIQDCAVHTLSPIYFNRYGKLDYLVLKLWFVRLFSAEDTHLEESRLELP